MIALFWDESFLWGLVAYDTFCRLNLNFAIVTADEIKEGVLSQFNVIFIPGGWASNKSKKLGISGKKAIREFVHSGGGYVGFCGGAGLALSHDHGLSLVSVKRKPTTKRVPSFSGKVRLRFEVPEHEIFRNASDSEFFSAWWPGQFDEVDTNEARILATYDKSYKNSYVSDIPVDDKVDWQRWEKIYQSNLNPSRLYGEPAVLESKFGDGKIILSYLHFETPGNDEGHIILKNIFEYLSGNSSLVYNETNINTNQYVSNLLVEPNFTAKNILKELKNKLPSEMFQKISMLAKLFENMLLSAEELISFGHKNFLWYWRTPWVLQWRRGTRGLEYCTLYILLKEINHRFFYKLNALDLSRSKNDKFLDEITQTIPSIENLYINLSQFVEKAKQLLLLERYEMTKSPLNPLTSDNQELQQLRQELFGNKKSFAGFYKEIIDEIDSLLLRLIR